jgi:hypothetical protein
LLRKLAASHRSDDQQLLNYRWCATGSFRRCEVRRSVLLTAAIAVCSVAGCSGWGVKPWQRDVLARPEMQLDNTPVLSSLDDHIYFSKEASSGGRAFGGGGCGCN